VATSRKNPGDFTATQRDAVNKQAAADKELRAQELTMATLAEEIRLTDSVVDYSGAPDGEIVPDDAEPLDPISDLTVTSDVDLKIDEVTLAPEKVVTIRVNAAIKDMTFGAGNYFSFEVGPKYKVPVALANHLDVLGYVWH
jgi:hypothetical protein